MDGANHAAREGSATSSVDVLKLLRDPGGSIFDPRKLVPPRTVLLRPPPKSGLLGSNEAFMDEDIARATRAKKGSPFLSTEQAAFYLGLSVRKLQQMRGEGSGPNYRRHSRSVRYHIDDLDNWSRRLCALELAQD